MKTKDQPKKTRKLASATTGFFSSPQAFSSVTDDWATPQWFFDNLNAEFGFIVDVCASTTNHKCDRWFGPSHRAPGRQDGLAAAWATDARKKGSGAVWMNPPYGRNIGAWMRKAAEESDHGAVVVCLVPARTDTSWFQDTALARMAVGRADVRFVRGRLKFGAGKSSAPFPSAVVVFRPES